MNESIVPATIIDHCEENISYCSSTMSCKTGHLYGMFGPAVNVLLNTILKRMRMTNKLSTVVEIVILLFTIDWVLYINLSSNMVNTNKRLYY